MEARNIADTHLPEKTGLVGKQALEQAGDRNSEKMVP
jgi:hypothetical protein